MKSLAIIIGAIVSIAAAQASANDLCQTRYTRLHLAQSQCFEIPRPLKSGSSETFKIRAVLVTKELATARVKPTIVIVPGGPGESSEPLKTELQKKELINGMWGPLEVNVVLFDPRGTGTSNLPLETTKYDGTVLSTQNQVNDLKAVIDTVSAHGPVYLFAHSAGGHIALAFAEKYPDALQGMLLLSTSQSPREMALMNIATYGLESSHWQEIQKLFPEGDRAELTAKYRRVEDVLVQQLKARLLKQDVHPHLKPVSPMDFRQILVRRMQEDPSGQTVRQFIESYDTALNEMDAEGPLLVPVALRGLKLRNSDLHQFSYSAKEWIQLQIMCGEGLLPSESDLPTIYDGVSMRRFCKDVAVQTAVVEPHLERIRIPVTVLSGDQDTQVPNYLSKRLAARLPNARLTIEPGAGHVFVDQKPMALYRAVEAMVRNAELSSNTH